MSANPPALHTVLLIEDEEDVRDLLRLHLKKAGFRVLQAADGLAGLKLARERRPDVVVLDLMLPEMRGEDVCRQLKQGEATAPMAVIMLTAKAGPRERVAGLELGADDYVTKPFSPRELVLRVRAVLRRVAQDGGGALRVGPFSLDRGNFTVLVEGEKLDLTTIEFKLLVMLMENRGRAISRETLLRDVWGYRNFVNSRTVDTHVRRLRSKLGAYAGWIETVRSEGYIFRAAKE